MKKSLRRVLALFVALFVALAMGLTVAHAATTVNLDNAPQGTHYTKGSIDPVCTLDEEKATVSCEGTQFAGVGNTNVTINLSLTATFTGECRNPGVNNKVVDPFTESVETEAKPLVVPSNKNGRLTVPDVSLTGTTEDDFLEDFSCPNDNWTPIVSEVEFSFEYSVTFAGFDDPVILITG